MVTTCAGEMAEGKRRRKKIIFFFDIFLESFRLHAQPKRTQPLNGKIDWKGQGKTFFLVTEHSGKMWRIFMAKTRMFRLRISTYQNK